MQTTYLVQYVIAFLPDLMISRMNSLPHNFNMTGSSNILNRALLSRGFSTSNSQQSTRNSEENINPLLPADPAAQRNFIDNIQLLNQLAVINPNENNNVPQNRGTMMN